MTSSAYMPDVRVEIAFNAGYRTPAADRTWTDVSDYVEMQESIAIKYGRQDEFSSADANTLSLVLDNRDGRFTWGNEDSPYYPNIKIGRPIRVIVDTPSNPAEVRFTGFVNEWPIQWPTAGDEYATVSITASSRLARLGLNSAALDVASLVVEPSAPTAYWPMTEVDDGPEASNVATGTPWSALSKSGFPEALRGTVTLGESDGPPLSDQKAPYFSAYGALRASTSTPVDWGDGLAVEVWAKQPSPQALKRILSVQSKDSTILVTGVDAHVENIGIETARVVLEWVNATGSDQFLDMDFTNPDLFADGLWHQVAVVLRTTTAPGIRAVAEMYVDGALDGTLDVTDLAPLVPRTARYISLGDTWSGTIDGFEGSIAHVLFYTGASADDLTAEVIAEHYNGIGLLLAGQTTDERLVTLAEWAKIPAEEVVTTPSPVTIAGAQSAGRTFLDLMRDVESAEGGVLYDDRDGRIVLEPRSSRYQSSGFDIDAAAQLVGADYEPTVDTQHLVNIAEVTGPSGAARYVDEASRTEYGDFAWQGATLAESASEPLHVAAAIVNANSEPRPRAGSLTVNVLDFILDGWDGTDEILGLSVGSLMTIANVPHQAPGETAYFIEGYSEHIGSESWYLTLNLSSAWPQIDVLILDEATAGALDERLVGF